MGFTSIGGERPKVAKDFNKKTKEELLDMLKTPSSEHHFQMYEALRKGATDEEIFAVTYEKAYFVPQMRELVELEEEMLKTPGQMPADALLIKAKKDGFSDKYIAKILGIRENDVRKKRTELGVVEGWCAVPVSGVDNQFYYYSTYNAKDESTASTNPKKIMILGGGPNRIGQGIEFDYCCCHAAMPSRNWVTKPSW